MEDLLRALLSSPHSALRTQNSALKGDFSPYLQVFLNLNDEIIAQGLLTQGEMEDFSRQSQSRRLPPPVLARAEKANSAFNLKFSRFNKRLNSAGQSVANLLNNNVGADPRAARSNIGSRSLQVATKLPFALYWELNGLLKTVSSWNRGMESDLLGSDLPYSSPAYKPQELASGQMVPAYLGGSGGSPIPGDLEGALGAEITPEIQAKVQELGNQPIEIYEYVKDNLGYEPYYGVMKGALETMRQGSGNDADLASLLIAMYRAAGFQARYVRGIARMPVDRLAAWMGLSASSSTPSPLVGEGGGEGAVAARVGQVLQAAAIPFTPVYAGGKITKYDVERIWVEVYLPYGEYRGAILNEKAGRMWIPLDPGFKQHNLEGEEIDLLTGMNKTGQPLGEEYLNTATGTTFLQFFRDQASSYLATAHPDLTLDDIKVNRVLKPERLRLLPNTLPYPVERVISEYAVLPDELIHQAKVTVFGSGGGTIYERTFKLPELAGKRFTLSYAGATPDDEAVIASYGGLMSTPPYLARVIPVIRLNGQPTSPSPLVGEGGGEGGAIGLGIKHSLQIEFISPSGSKRVESEVIAGNYYGLGVAAQKSSFLDPDSFVQCPSEECVGMGVGEGLVPSRIGGEDTDGLGGRLLYQRAVGYLNQLYTDEEEIASLLGIRLIRPEASLVIVGNELEVTYLSGIPQLMEWKGVRIDVRSRTVAPVILRSLGVGGQPTSNANNFMLLSGFESSSLENLVFEKDFGVESVSAVKVLQLAHAQGMEVVTITKDNIDAVLPTVDCSNEVREDIVNKVNQGLRLTIPASPLTYFNWTGTGYVALDPVTGDAGYFLSGRIAGGMTVYSIDLWDWRYSSVLSNSNALNGIEKDPSLAAAIIKLEGDYQDGEVGKKLKVPLRIQVTTGGDKPKAVVGATVVFQTEVGGGTFDGGANQVVLTTGPDGTVGAYLWPGIHTSDNPVYVLDASKPEYIQAGFNVVKVYLMDKPGVYEYFQALGFPGNPEKIVGINHHHDGGKVCSFNGFFDVAVLDHNDNPVSNVEVRVSVLEPENQSPPQTCPSGFKNALIYEWHELCPVDYPTLDTRDEYGARCGKSSFNKLTRADGVSVLTIMGNVPAYKYQFKAEVPAINNYGLIDQITGPIAGSDPSVPHPPVFAGLEIEYTVPASVLGYPINGIQVGTELSRPVVMTLYGTVEDDADGDGNGDGTFSVTRVNDGNVEFTPNPQGGVVPSVLKVEKHMEGGSQVPGEYLAWIKVAADPAGENCYRMRGYDSQKGLWSGYKDYRIYGVNASITGVTPELLPLSRQWRTAEDLQVGYRIKPDGYQAATSQMLFFRGGDVIWSSPEKFSGEGISVLKEGSQFEVGNDYYARLVLNLGSPDMEIKSDPVEIKMIALRFVDDIAPSYQDLSNDSDNFFLRSVLDLTSGRELWEDENSKRHVQVRYEVGDDEFQNYASEAYLMVFDQGGENLLRAYNLPDKSEGMHDIYAWDGYVVKNCLSSCCDLDGAKDASGRKLCEKTGSPGVNDPEKCHYGDQDEYVLKLGFKYQGNLVLVDSLQVVDLAWRHRPVIHLRNDEPFVPTVVESVFPGSMLYDSETGEVLDDVNINSMDDLLTYDDSKYYLRIHESKLQLTGESTDPPAVYIRSISKNDHVFLQYWMFYAGSTLALHEKEKIKDLKDIFHEGDWEGVQIHIPTNEIELIPSSVTFSIHHYGLTLPWPGVFTGGKAGEDYVKTDGQRVKVFVAGGSHASYPNGRESEEEGDGYNCYYAMTNPRAFEENTILECPAKKWDSGLHPLTQLDRVKKYHMKEYQLVGLRNEIAKWKGNWGRKGTWKKLWKDNPPPSTWYKYISYWGSNDDPNVMSYPDIWHDIYLRSGQWSLKISP
jgi:transglutaminase-like putative cysteine protease